MDVYRNSPCLTGIIINLFIDNVVIRLLHLIFHQEYSEKLDQVEKYASSIHGNYNKVLIR